MKKWLKTSLIIIFVLAFSSCSNEEIVTNNIDIEQIVEDVYDFDNIDRKTYKIANLTKGGEFTKGRFTSVLVNYTFQEFSIDKGIFEEKGGFNAPCELIYEKVEGKYILKSINFPQDGEDYNSSLKKMTRNDRMLREKIEFYDENSVINKLKKRAMDLGCLECFHDKSFVKNLYNEYIFLPTENDDVIDLVEKSKYNRELLSESQSNSNLVEGIRYFKNEELALKTLVDIDNEIEEAKISEDIRKYKNISKEKSEFIAVKKLNEQIKENEKQIIVRLFWGRFSLNNRIFSIDSKYETIAKLIYNKNNDLISFLEAGSGEGYKPIVKAMVGGDEAIYKKILDSNQKPDYIFAMAKKAEDLSLHNYILSSDNVPGFDKDVVQIQDPKCMIVDLIRKSDYELVKNRINQGETVSLDGVRYYYEHSLAIRKEITIKKDQLLDLNGM